MRRNDGHCDNLVVGHCGDCPSGPLSDWSRSAPLEALELAGIVVRKNFASGECIFRIGTFSQALYCLGSGLAGLRMLHPEGTSVLVDIVGPGDLLGTRAFLRNGRHRTSAEALTPVRLCKLPRSDAQRLVDTHPQLHRRLVQRCLDALDASQQAMLNAAALSNRDRLLHLLKRLIEHCRKAGLSDHSRSRLPLSREDIAGMLGVRQETLSRLLGRLKEDGLIEVSGRHIVLRNTESSARGRFSEI